MIANFTSSITLSCKCSFFRYCGQKQKQINQDVQNIHKVNCITLKLNIIQKDILLLLVICAPTLAVSSMWYREGTALCLQLPVISEPFRPTHLIPASQRCHTLFDWDDQHVANSLNLAHAANGTQNSKSMPSLTDCCYGLLQTHTQTSL